MTDAVSAMLRARSVALVGASARPGTFGARMLDEVTRGSADRQVHLVNPRYDEIGGRACVPSLKHLDGPVDLALLAVNDDVLEDQLRDAAETGARSAVIFGSAQGRGRRDSLHAIAVDAGMALCGAGCMGFVNVTEDLRATGYVERPELPRGPIALVTHSGSIFSALLRTRRPLGFTLAVSSGQELVTTTADYLEHVLDHTDTTVIALVLETVRDGERMIAGLRRAAADDVPVVVLPVGASALGAELVGAHSGALAGDRGMWEALAEGTGALLVRDLAELTDTLECLALGTRARSGRGLASVHDSGAERTLVADLAEELTVPFAPLAPDTLRGLAGVLDDGLVAGNPLDLWGGGADTRAAFGAALTTIAADPAVSVLALAIDLVEEYDGDRSYVDAALDVDRDVPLVVLTNLACAVDEHAAAELRSAGIPVLEGTSSGLVAIRNLLSLATHSPAEADTPPIDRVRQARWIERLTRPEALGAVESFALLADYGIPVVATRAAASAEECATAARELGYPVVLKTAAPAVAHKSDVGGVVLGIETEAVLCSAYRDLAQRLGSDVLVSSSVRTGVEIALGVVRDPQIGALVVVGAGGVLTELLDDRAVALAPVSPERAAAMVDRLRVRRLLDGWRGTPSVDPRALVDAIVAVGAIAAELGHHLRALDVNPVVVGPRGVVAVDVFVQKMA